MNHFCAAADNVKSRDMLQKSSTNNITIISYQLKLGCMERFNCRNGYTNYSIKIKQIFS